MEVGLERGDAEVGDMELHFVKFSPTFNRLMSVRGLCIYK